eukprot:420372-Rhodomonas_salina.2
MRSSMHWHTAVCEDPEQGSPTSVGSLEDPRVVPKVTRTRLQARHRHAEEEPLLSLPVLPRQPPQRLPVPRPPDLREQPFRLGNEEREVGRHCRFRSVTSQR